MKTTIGLLLCMALVASCGGSKKQAVASVKNAGAVAPASGAQTQGSHATTSTTTGKKGSQAASTTSPAGATQVLSSNSTTTRPHVPVQVKLDKKCVRRGETGDVQGLTVKTDPSGGVAYSTEYSDHSTDFGHPEWKDHGAGFGQAHTDGEFRVEWKVPANAPTGLATLRVIAHGEIQQPPLTFKVVLPIQSC